MFEALKNTEKHDKKSYFAGVLGKISRDVKVFQLLVKLLEEETEHKAVYAIALADFGDPKAIPFLEKELSNESISYIDFREVKSVIEELGGEVNIDRDFGDDPWFKIEKQYSGLGDILNKAEMVKGYGLYEGIEWERGTGSDLGDIDDWEDEDWYEDDDYWEEEKSVPIRVEKIGRNEPCPCGSGKKYKKCCSGNKG